MLLAHCDKERSLEQSLLDHSISTGILAKNMGERIDLENMSFVVGILHDIGKADRIFQEKLNSDSSKKVIHSSAGLKYLVNFLEKNDKKDRLFREYIEVLAYSIGAHHSVFDIPGKDEDYVWTSRLYLKALYNTKKYHYQEDVLKYIEELDSYIKNNGEKQLKIFCYWVLMNIKCQRRN